MSWAIAVVIAVIPITIVVPAVAVFIPPTMVFIPTAFACFTQLAALMIRLPAVRAVAFYSLVQFVVCLGDAPLALIVGVLAGKGARSRRKCQQANERSGSKHRASPKSFATRKRGHVSPSSLSSPDWDGNLVPALSNPTVSGM